MYKKKKLTSITVASVCLLLLSGCNHSAASPSPSAKQKQTNTSNAATNTHASADKHTDNDNTNDALDNRVNAILDATLTYKQQNGINVDFKTKTMVEDGQEVGFAIVPDQDHQNDFKVGMIKEKIQNKDESHDLTIFSYQIDDRNKLSLIDPATNKAVYTETIK